MYIYISVWISELEPFLVLCGRVVCAHWVAVTWASAAAQGLHGALRVHAICSPLPLAGFLLFLPVPLPGYQGLRLGSY